MPKPIKGKYPIQFWIDETLKQKSDEVREKKRLSHKDLYEKGIEIEEKSG